MSDFDDKMNRLLSSPESMEQVMRMARQLSGSGEPDSAAPPSDPSVPSQASQEGEARDPVSAVFSDPSLGAIDPKIMQTVMRVMREYSGDDSRLQLLSALKVHLNTGRAQRVDRAAQMLRLSKTVRAALEIFTGGNDVV